MNILFVASEAHPLIKTGGLGDVAGYLPPALSKSGASVCVAIPGYTEVLEKIPGFKPLDRYHIDGFSVDIIESRLPNSDVKLWVVCCPQLFEREGGPYQDDEGRDWPDNALRFGVFAKVIVAITQNWIELDWPVDLVHCNDWQTGLIPALLKLQTKAPATLFTIHNLAYQGLFPYHDFARLQLPPHLWTHHALEFHEQLSFLKGGLVFADRINTVSPSYAEEIQTREFGCGLDGLLRYRSEALSGILNGADTQQWNPATDAYLASTYNKSTLTKKAINKLALQALFELPQDKTIPLFSVVTRLTQQKGIDLILDAIPMLQNTSLQFAILGTGDKRLELRLRNCARKHRDRFAIKLAYNESWAHLAIAGADAFLMPSRFEPCGLTQLYSLRYGTIPVVHAVGGLMDTVIDASADNLAAKKANGVQYKKDTAKSLVRAIQQTLKLYDDKPVWKSMQRAAMQQDFSWPTAAEQYMALYKQILSGN
ncbi:MAG: glycogen synthase GlgA [Gammaproteobacteria bacterium]|nr:glycogen synthase GlgA [Gammaproteobacteria bacterium]